MILTTVAFYFLTMILEGVQCGLTLKVIPESVQVKELNDKYLKWATFNIRRYQRKGDYYVNISAHFLQTWTNNVTIRIVLTEYLHNEYRPSFIQAQYKFCDFVNNEPYIGGMIKKSGLPCPTPAGEHRMMNMTVQTDNFPNVFPFTKGGANVEFITETGEIIASVEYHAKFIQNKKP